MPSVPESTRVNQQVNKRSIDDDVKEFFAIKNLAHFHYDIENRKPVHGRAAPGGLHFAGTLSNIDKSFDSYMGNDERTNSMRQAFGQRLNRKTGLGIRIPNDENAADFPAESPQVNMSI